MRRMLSSAPLPALGYVLTLIGFVFLGLFITTLGFGGSHAPTFGIAMFVSYAAAVLCFALRRHQIAVEGPDSDMILGLDPIRGNTARSAAQRYVLNYRGVRS